MNLIIQQALFTEFRPVFILMLAILAVFFFLSFFRDGERRGITFSLVLIVSIINTLIAFMIFFVENNLVETYSLTPDRITLFLFIGIIALSLVNPFIYKMRNKASSRYRYRYRR